MFKKGDVYLADFAFDREEAEILQVLESDMLVRWWIEGVKKDQWMRVTKFVEKRPSKIGRVEYRGFWIFKRRVVVKE